MSLSNAYNNWSGVFLEHIPHACAILEIDSEGQLRAVLGNSLFASYSAAQPDVLTIPALLATLTQLPENNASTLRFEFPVEKGMQHAEVCRLPTEVPHYLFKILHTAAHSGAATTESKERFRALVMQGPELSAILSADGRFQFLSANHESVLGYTDDMLAGQSLFDYIHIDDLEKTRADFQLLHSDSTVKLSPYRFKRRNGSWCWLQSRASNQLADPMVEAVIMSSVDIDDMVQIQKSLHQSNERFQLINKASNDAIYDWDIVKDVFEWGEGYYKIFGYTKTRVPFRLAQWIKLTHHSDVIKHEERWNSFLTNKDQQSWSNEFRFLKSDGSYAYVEEIGYLIRDEHGLPIRMIGALRDVSQARYNQLQKQVVQEVNQLFKKDADLATLLTDLSSYLATFSQYDLVEIWLGNRHHDYLVLSAQKCSSEQSKLFVELSKSTARISKQQGLPGAVWNSKQIEQWNYDQIDQVFVRRQAARATGLKSLIGIPIQHNDMMLGVIVLGSFSLTTLPAHLLNVFDLLPYAVGTEIKRKSQEEEMQMIFDNSPDILALVAPNGYFLKVNPAFCKILGYTEKELTAAPFRSFVHPDDLNGTLQEFDNMVGGDHQANNYVNRYISKTGEICWISWSSSVVFGEDRLAYSYGRNITALKKLEELVDSTARLARVGSWEVDLLSKQIFCSPIARELLELPDNYVLTLTNDLRYIKESSRVVVRRLLQEAIFDQKPWDIEIEVRTGKREFRWVRLIGQASFQHGRCTRIFGSLQDIHEKKLVQLELEEAHYRFKRVSDATSDAIWDWDLLKQTKTWNKNYFKLFGYSEEDRIRNTKAWEELVHPADLPALSVLIAQTCSDPSRNLFETEYRFRRKDGSYADVSDKGAVIRNEFGQAVRMVGALTDISHRKEYERSLTDLNMQLKRINHELAGSNAELEQFAFVASHDLQEPLRMISGFLTMLEKKYGPQLDDKANQYIYYAVDGAKRMRSIILDLLEYSRVGRINTTREMVNSAEMVVDVKKLLQNLLDEYNVTITTDQLPEFQAYKLPFQQVLQNLISNAVKYSRKGVPPQIHVSCTQDSNYWTFSVADNGMGIDSSYLEKIFIIFHRLQYTQDIPGSGLGLAIAKKIIEWQGGRIWVDSTVGVGSTFHFTLPK